MTPQVEVAPSPKVAVAQWVAEGKIDEALELLSQSIAKRETADLWNDWKLTTGKAVGFDLVIDTKVGPQA